MALSFIIHLPGGTTREALVAALVDALPGAKVVEAVDGRALTPSERDAACVPVRFRPTYPFPLLPAEIGCFLSHRRCWERIAAGAAPWGLIAEDDVTLDTALFPRALALAQTHARPDRVIRFPLKHRDRPAETLARDGEIALFRPRVVGLSGALQILGRDVAARLLDLTAPFDRPVDTFLQMRWLTGADVLSVYPNGAASAADSTGGSTIQQSRPLREKVRRSLHRARYRAEIRRLSLAGAAAPRPPR